MTPSCGIKVKRIFHHDAWVFVKEELEGRSWDFCLCAICANLTPEDVLHNCQIANALYRFCVENNLVAPIFECPVFREKVEKK